MEKLLMRAGDDLGAGLLRSLRRFMLKDLIMGGGLGEPTEISDSAGLGVRCGIFRRLWPPGPSASLRATFLGEAIKNASAKTRGSHTENVGTTCNTNTNNENGSWPKFAAIRRSLCHSLWGSLSWALSTGLGPLTGFGDVTSRAAAQLV